MKRERGDTQPSDLEEEEDEAHLLLLGLSPKKAPRAKRKVLKMF